MNAVRTGVTRTGVTRFTLLMVLYLCRLYYGLHAVLRLHIGRTLQYLRTFIPLLLSLFDDLADPVFDGVRPAGVKSRKFLLA